VVTAWPAWTANVRQARTLRPSSTVHAARRVRSRDASVRPVSREVGKGQPVAAPSGSVTQADLAGGHQLNARDTLARRDRSMGGQTRPFADTPPT
jgi:hypothetical protein